MADATRTLEQHDLKDHYCNLADSYDHYYLEFEDVQVQSAIESLDLHPNHVIVDIGGGTGRFAEKMSKFARLKNPITCVDPCAEMIEKAKGREGIIPVLKTGEEFFKDALPRGSFDRVLFKYSLHHLQDPLPVFKAVERSLCSNGMCLVWIFRSLSCYKLFRQATDIPEQTSLEKIQEICKLLEEANFEVETSKMEYKYGFTKSKFYSMLRGRFMSPMYKMTDPEIEKGIESLERGELGLLKDHEIIETVLVNCAIKAKKIQ